jgi:hypothetical protein
MKKLILFTLLSLGMFSISQAQVMNCRGSWTGAKITFIEQDLNTVTLLVDWDEGSTFSSSSLTLGNATCASCPRIGGIGRPFGIQKTYVLNKIDNSQAVTIDWGPIGTNVFCGSSSITVPPIFIAPLSDVTVQGCNGAIATYDFSSAVSSPLPVTSITYSVPSGSIFNLGSTPVTMTATNAEGSATATFNVIIEDKVPPTITLNGANPQETCLGEPYVELRALAEDNCSPSPALQISGSVDVNTPGPYTVTYTVTDDAGNTASATRTVTVKPKPAALEQDNCPNSNPNCDQIILRVCPYQDAPDLTATAMSNPAYVSGASFNWYTFNGASNPPGAQLPGPPSVDMEAPASNTNAWVTQVVGGCESAPTRVRVRVKPDRDPNLTLNGALISLPSCGGAGTVVDFEPGISGYASDVVRYDFYQGKPNQGGTFLKSVNALSGGAPAPFTNVPVFNGTNDYYVQTVLSNPNRCGGEASATLTTAGGATPSMDPVSSLTVSGCDQVNINFTGNFDQVVWYNLGNPDIGIVGSAGSGNLVFSTLNPGSSLIANLFAIPYSNGCAGAPVYFSITVNPSSAICRQGSPNQLQLFASLRADHEVAISWDLTYDQELVKFEVEREIGEDEYVSIGEVAYGGDGSYHFLDTEAYEEVNRYRIKMVHPDGRIVWSETVEAGKAALANNRFEVFPNPTSGQLQLRSMQALNASYQWQLTDMVGKRMLSGVMAKEEINIDLSGLPSGIYQLMGVSENGARFVKQVVKE